MEGRIAQDDQAAVKLLDQPRKGVVRDMRSGPVPPYHQAILVQQQTEFVPDNPPMVGQTFPTDLLGAATLPDGVDEFDPPFRTEHLLWMYF